MFFGRNENDGLRWVYHGWKFDVEGNCVDAPNLPNDQIIRNKVKAKSYKVQERAGLIWVYMGKREPAWGGFDLAQNLTNLASSLFFKCRLFAFWTATVLSQ
jgi:phthalate 4,5-dioxygenase oxygenase subunit